MKILQLSKYYPPFHGGIELVAKMFSKAHIQAGDSVTIISFGGGDKEYDGEFGEKVLQVNEDWKILSTPMNRKLISGFCTLVKRLQINKIYAHLPNPYMHLLLQVHQKRLKKMGVEICAIYHSDIVSQKYIGAVYDQLFLRTCDFYDQFICSSDKLWETSPVLSKIDSKKRKIIPFCTDCASQFKLRKRFNGNILAIGRLVPYKGFEFLVDAVKDTPYQLTIIGDGPLRSRLQQMAGTNVNFVFNASDEEKRMLMNQSDLFVLSSISRAEAYGIVIVEAFENGLPVVASDIDSGVTFLVKSGTRGATFPVESRKDFLDCLSLLHKRDDLMQKYSLEARRFFEQQLSFEAFAKNVTGGRSVISSELPSVRQMESAA